MSERFESPNVECHEGRALQRTALYFYGSSCDVRQECVKHVCVVYRKPKISRRHRKRRRDLSANACRSTKPGAL